MFGTIPVVPGNQYTLSTYLRNSAGVRIEGWWKDADGNNLTDASGGYIGSTYAYPQEAEHRITFTTKPAPDDAVVVQVQIALGSATKTADPVSYDYRMAQLEEGAEATPWSPAQGQDFESIIVGLTQRLTKLEGGTTA